MIEMLEKVSEFAHKWRFEFNNQKCGIMEYKGEQPVRAEVVSLRLRSPGGGALQISRGNSSSKW